MFHPVFGIGVCRPLRGQFYIFDVFPYSVCDDVYAIIPTDKSIARPRGSGQSKTFIVSNGYGSNRFVPAVYVKRQSIIIRRITRRNS